LQTTFRRPHWKEIGQLGWTTGGGGRIKLLENIDRATKKKQLFVPHWVVPQQDSLAVFNGHPSFWTSVRKNDADVVAIMVADTASLRAFMLEIGLFYLPPFQRDLFLHPNLRTRASDTGSY
jgi:hypothetical protein